jgi:phosphate transport system substrate-binding protein
MTSVLRSFAVVVGVLGLWTSAIADCTGPLGFNVINLVGSGTTQPLMSALAEQYNGSSQATSDIAQVVSTPATLPPGGSSEVPGDDTCPGFAYTNPGNPPPNDSSAGIAAVQNNAGGDGCTDGARSTRGANGTTDNPNDEFWAFARDAVTWTRFGKNAPVSLTPAQLQGIYLCTSNGAPTITNWQQVGGKNAAIVRYLPPSGSDTLSFFETKLLGLSTTQQGVADGTACTVPPKRIDENDGTGVIAADATFAIYPFLYSQWRADANGVQPDERNGAALGEINDVVPNVTTINRNMNPFVARRWVYNVLLPGLSFSEWRTAIKIVGVSTAAPGYLCKSDATVQHLVAQFGYVVIPFGATGGPGLKKPPSHCRLDPVPL